MKRSRGRRRLVSKKPASRTRSCSNTSYRAGGRSFANSSGWRESNDTPMLCTPEFASRSSRSSGSPLHRFVVKLIRSRYAAGTDSTNSMKRGGMVGSCRHDSQKFPGGTGGRSSVARRNVSGVMSFSPRMFE